MSTTNGWLTAHVSHRDMIFKVLIVKVLLNIATVTMTITLSTITWRYDDEIFSVLIKEEQFIVALLRELVINGN